MSNAMSKHKVLIVVRGGLVQYTASTSADIEIVVQDLDNLRDVLEFGEGDCSYIETPVIMDNAEIAAEIAGNLE